MNGSKEDPRYTKPAGERPSGRQATGDARQSSSPAGIWYLAEALVAVDVTFAVTMYEISSAAGLLISSTYLYRLRGGEKENPSLEKLALIVAGIREARGAGAAKFFLVKLFGLDRDGHFEQLVWDIDPSPSTGAPAR